MNHIFALTRSVRASRPRSQHGALAITSPCLITSAFTILCFIAMPIAAHAQVKVTFDHNPNAAATRAFKFKNVPSPAKDDAATKAKLLLVEGEADANGADLNALTDGALPTEEDQPAANFFWNAGTGGGRFQMDLGNMIEIAQVNTYSWHPNTRGPQVYRLWASDGAAANFTPAPKTKVDLAATGWKLITVVDTRSKEGDDGGQFGVSITDAQGSLGKFRYLLFDCYVTETADEFGNTFYSEIDVIAKR
ncbi:MAG: hypothetical protein QOI77_3502 [Blastocatellia bacterium]|jgi:hypothetical protein|nr:hypothetical protein [Blastocatellia bacterium]